MGGGDLMYFETSIFIHAQFDSKIYYIFIFTWLSFGLWNIYGRDPCFNFEACINNLL